jgi:hypothetical protein
MTFNPDPWIKGDFSIKTKGVLGLIHKETLLMRRNEFLQMTANPFDLQIMGLMGRAYVLRENARGLQLDTDKIVPPEEQLQKARAVAAQQQAAAQQGAQGQTAPAPQAGNPGASQAPNPGVGGEAAPVGAVAQPG